MQYRLRVAGWTLRRLSVRHGRGPAALRMGLRRGTQWALEAVADALQISPAAIWPSRYRKRKSK